MEIDVDIGKHLKTLMEKRGITDEKVMQILGYEREEYERLIRGEVSPGVSDMLKLVTFLGTDIPALLYGMEYGEKKAIKTGIHDRLKISRARCIDYESLASGYSGRHMEPFFVTIYRQEEETPTLSRHNGEEFLFVTKGTLLLNVDGEEYTLGEGDSIYFDSSLPHTVDSITEATELVISIYKGDSMVHLTRGRRMRAIIDAARLLEKKAIAVACPDRSAISAVNIAIEESIIDRAWLVGDTDQIRKVCGDELRFEAKYEWVDVKAGSDTYEREASARPVSIVREKKAHMIMKGKLNTSSYMKTIMNRERGIGTGRRLSLVGIFEIPGIDRLVMLTDPGINPELFENENPESGVDIVKNAIGVAKSLGVHRPKVALLDANEVPSSTIPTTIREKQLSEMTWSDADVSGPLSYDLALYEEYSIKKGFLGNPVAGKADILVVPSIATGNILYKCWVMTMGAEVANVVVGAKAPVILTSRSDTDVVKFLTICVSSLYSNYMEKMEKQGYKP